MESRCLTVHPRYGAIYHEGEFVQRGAVVGLALDSKEVVIAPISGWVRLRQLQGCDATEREGVHLEIWRDRRPGRKHPGTEPVTNRLPA